jgi:type IV secretion system protein VirD4
MSASPGWGPRHQRPPGFGTSRLIIWGSLIAFVALLALPSIYASMAALVVILVFVTRVLRRNHGRSREAKPAAGAGLASAPDPLGAVLDQTARLGGGVYLGATSKTWVCARPEHAVLLLGPPRSGKTTAVMTPAVLAHSGPVVCASTKPDVLAATSAARSRLGRVWEFDPTGERSGLGPEAELRWSPVTAARTWDGALLMARSMVTGSHVGQGTSDSTHWSKRATAALAPLLHAASLAAHDIGTVTGWVLGHDLEPPTAILRRSRATAAMGVLAGLEKTEARERSSILSAAADALDAYSSTGALAAAQSPNFGVEQFVRSGDTIFIHAPAEHQALAAPLVCGLLSEIRAATYKAHRDGQLSRRLLFALDEAANIAPLGDLPQIASEGGGQGLQLLAAFQDLSQARGRWGPAADGFLTLFGTKLILPGIADTRTLEAISIALGEYDRQVVSSTRNHPQGLLLSNSGHDPRRSTTISTQRTRVLSPGEVANIPAGQGLHLEGVHWQLLTLTPAPWVQPWATLTASVDAR